MTRFANGHIRGRKVWLLPRRRGRGYRDLAHLFAEAAAAPYGTVKNCDHSEIIRRIDRILAVPEAESRSEVRRVMSAMSLKLDAAAEMLRQKLSVRSAEYRA